MPKITRTVEVQAPPDFCLEVTNQLEMWPQIMAEYRRVEILGHEGLKVWFRISHANGTEWVSWRVICPEGRFAYAERHEPKKPFQFMHILWYYRDAAEGGTSMTWTMTCELADATADVAKFTDTLTKHTEENQTRMKAYIEALWKDGQSTSAQDEKGEPTSL